MTSFRLIAPLCLTFLLAGPAAGQEAKRVLDHDAYDIWNRMVERAISANGEWALYVYGPEDGDTELRVTSLSSDTEWAAERGSSAKFTHDGRFVIFKIKPPKSVVRQAEEDDVQDARMPKDSLGILDLESGAIVRIPGVSSFEIPEEAGGWVAYLHEKIDAESDTTDETPSSPGNPVTLRNLATGEETLFPAATDYVLSGDGRFFVYSASKVDSTADGIFLVDTDTGRVDTLLSGPGEYLQASFDEAGAQMAFLSSREVEDTNSTATSLHLWSEETLGVETLASPESEAVPNGWVVGTGASVDFSKDGMRLFFGTAPRAVPDPEDAIKVKLDVWNWQDPLLQPMQLQNLEREKNRTYLAVIHLDDRRIVQLASEVVPDVEVGRDGEADFALGISNMPYRQEISWDYPGRYDAWGIDVQTGERRLLVDGIRSRPSLSPDAQYILWWDGNALAWMALATEGKEPVNLTAAIPHPVHRELHDRPSTPGAYGIGGWTSGDELALIYDDFDVWAVDPLGVKPPMSVTGGHGRTSGLRLRLVKLDDEPAWEPSGEILLSAFNTNSKVSGFFEMDSLSDSDDLEELVMANRRFTTPQKAEDSDRLLFTRESFVEFPDVWVSGPDMDDMRPISDVNPQQAEYVWGTAELVEWTSLDGIQLKGILYKPDGFDPAKRYPMLVYFYERMSDRLHQYRPPETARSSISFSFYVSRGYIVFVPDIPYRVGYPGESALHAVVPGVTKLLETGFVQEDAIGVQGHSWGGYQIAYMISETDLFAAAEAGAPVSNMTSAYGGIRWGSGMSRMFQYERTQSRIGGSLWEYPLRYIDNSPLFQADKINTPLLMLHNDEDGAVPWYQGIELFVALRRLGSPVWMLNYNGEAHGLRNYENKRDFAIRMQQFFDHYLKGAPAPVWMERGIPAVLKGKTLGLETEGAGNL